jgi:glyoxylase-like metal-dependent hydrolase (beta-lactamase superfamily II)
MIEKPYSEFTNEYLPIKTNYTPIFFNETKYDILSEPIEVIFTPGHSPGGVCLYLRENTTLITGDTIFRGTVGR